MCDRQFLGDIASDAKQCPVAVNGITNGDGKKRPEQPLMSLVDIFNAAFDRCVYCGGKFIG